MQIITSLTNEPKQRCQLVLENNETVDFRLYYLSRMQSWYYDFTYRDLTVKCSKVVLTPNSIRQYRRILPFGLAFIADSEVQPFSITDFSDGRVQLAILNFQEVQDVEETIFNTL